MGSYDGAEICELVGIYILTRLATIIKKSDCGLYRDDGLVILRNVNGQQIDRTRKNIIKIFKDIGFGIDIETNSKVVDFLDITFNLNNGIYKPYKKPNDRLLYINKSSNHPPQIINQLPKIISDRLSRNSSNKEVFNTAKGEYEEALKRSGYSNFSLSFLQSSTSRVKRQPHRNIIWFNPPYSRAVITNIAKEFLQLIDLHFPPSNKFHKIFNRNNVKVSYCCTQNVGNIIKSHNKKLINSSNHHEQPCNCRKKEDCPLEGKCRTENIIYKCIASTSSHPDKVYLGTAEDFKKMYNHISPFKNETQINKTTLAKYV